MNIKKINILNILMSLTIIELVLGGSGRLIVIGNVSLRMILFIAMILFTIILICHNKIKLNYLNFSIFIFLLYLILNLLFSLLINNPINAIDEFTGYLTILYIPIFSYYYKLYPSMFYHHTILFRKMVFLLALISIFVWGYAFITGPSSYTVIHQIMNDYSYGNFDFIGIYPRIFFKCSIFFFVGLFLHINDWRDIDNKLVFFVKLSIYIFSILTTFTTSYYIFSVLVLIIYSVINSKLSIMRIISYSLIAFIIFIFIYNMGFIDILNSRFSGDYTWQYKFVQSMNLIKEIIKVPIFGSGLGHTLVINYGYTISKSIYSFEVMWLQCIYHLGFVGFLLFCNIIIFTMQRLFHLYKVSRSNIPLVLFLSILYIIFVSFTNPYFNNTIGITFFSLCSSIPKQFANYGRIRN